MTTSSERDSRTGGLVAETLAGGLAERLGIRAGDVVVGINGMPVRDVLDVVYHSADAGVERIEIERDGRRFVVQGVGDDLGLEFESWTFDGIRRCRNHCLFCFVDQLPPGMRPSLYVKDDDYRYSVLCGNFVTLTNLTADDWERLEEQRLGPLRVSVHSTDVELRRLLLGNRRAPDVVTQIESLGRLHIAVHGQVVLVPGVNDGEHLRTTIDDLGALYPTVRSVAVVPVGRTAHARQRKGVTVREFTPTEAGAVVDQVTAAQRAFRKKLGVGLVYLADEFYLRAGRPVPSARSYDGFPQYENGVGMVRSLLDDWASVRKKAMSARTTRRLGSDRRATIVCGTAIASVMGDIVDGLAKLSGLKGRLLPVENRFFGPTVTVSGLLTGGDVVKTLRGRDSGDLVILPRTMLDGEGKVTLDDESPDSLETKLGLPVVFAGSVSEMVRLWSGIDG